MKSLLCLPPPSWCCFLLLRCKTLALLCAPKTFVRVSQAWFGLLEFVTWSNMLSFKDKEMIVRVLSCLSYLVLRESLQASYEAIYEKHNWTIVQLNLACINKYVLVIWMRARLIEFMSWIRSILSWVVIFDLMSIILLLHHLLLVLFLFSKYLTYISF